MLLTITFNKSELSPMRLCDLVPGASARLVAVGGSDEVSLRLMEMGLVRGTVVTVRRVAPLGDPLELELRGYRLSIRRAEAARFTVEPVPSPSALASEPRAPSDAPAASVASVAGSVAEGAR